MEGAVGAGTDEPDGAGGDYGDDGLLEEWYGKLTRAIGSMRDCGPLEAMQKLDVLVRSAALEGRAQAMRALGLAWVRVLAGRPESLTLPVIRAAGSYGIAGAQGPLLAHVYGEGFWPAVSAGDGQSRFTDLQRRAIVLALVELECLRPEKQGLLYGALADWFGRRAVPVWRRGVGNGLVRLLRRWGLAGKAVGNVGVLEVPETGEPMSGLTLRELGSHAFALGRICPRERVTALATMLADCPVPILGVDGRESRILKEGLHAEFFRGWLTRHHQGTLRAHPERVMQVLPTAFATDGRLIQRIAAHLEEDFARYPNPLSGRGGVVDGR